MKFKEKDIHLMIDGMGIVFYSPETNKNIQNQRMLQSTSKRVT